MRVNSSAPDKSKAFAASGAYTSWRRALEVVASYVPFSCACDNSYPLWMPRSSSCARRVSPPWPPLGGPLHANANPEHGTDEESFSLRAQIGVTARSEAQGGMAPQ